MEETTSPGVEIQHILTAVQAAVAIAQRDLKDERMPPLKSVALTLTAEAKKSAGGKISFWVVTVGGTTDRSRTQEVELTLVPPLPSKPRKLALRPPGLTDQLAAAITGAARGARAAQLDPDVPLELASLKVTLAFVVKHDGSAGAKFELLPVGFDLSGSVGQALSQKIVVTFDTPAPT